MRKNGKADDEFYTMDILEYSLFVVYFDISLLSNRAKGGNGAKGKARASEHEHGRR